MQPMLRKSRFPRLPQADLQLVVLVVTEDQQRRLKMESWTGLTRRYWWPPSVAHYGGDSPLFVSGRAVMSLGARHLTSLSTWPRRGPVHTSRVSPDKISNPASWVLFPGGSKVPLKYLCISHRRPVWSRSEFKVLPKPWYWLELLGATPI